MNALRWSLTSRVHPLNHFPGDGVTCFVKRDDELGCGISGTKMRKYSSVIPFLIENAIRHLIIIAGPQSNNLLAALQIAREHQLKVTVFLIRPRHLVIQGNFKLSQLFLEEQNIIWIDREDWSSVYSRAEKYLSELKETGFILREGASVPEALSGAITIVEDIINNEKELSCTFQHIFVDAGTGFSAAALIKGLAQANHPALIHVLLLADNEDVFKQKLAAWIGENPVNYQCFYPGTARSFGSVNQVIKNEIKRVAREEGILVDPIYSAKLFHEARNRIEQERLQGNVLIIHSGGALTMAGFEF